MDTLQLKRNNERIKKKRKAEGIDRRKKTLIKKAYELGEFDGIDVALIICKHGRYTTYRSTERKTWPPSMAEIQTAYPIPKNMIPEDMKKRVSRHGGGFKLPEEKKSSANNDAGA
ncbi:hypothetical protein BKA61DRAFT_494765 [Leptodontidium sp. MPI-SDFR-AT-0119]|nr:hypothetical protein BKA61DRAFT_494765 [Leptodontidium sp. MPI-SDFR-AT-0119]